MSVQYPVQCINSPSQHFAGRNSLRTAVAYMNLTEELESNKLAAGFLWLIESYVPWHSVAITLAELCREPRGVLADEAWALVLKGFEKWGEQMAGSKRGMLWRPVKNLMRKARAERARERNFVNPQNLSLGPGLQSRQTDVGLLDFDMGTTQDDPHEVLGGVEKTTIPAGKTTFEMDATGGDLLYADAQQISSNWDLWNDFVLEITADNGDVMNFQGDAWIP